MKELIANTGIQYIEIPIILDEENSLSSNKSFAEVISTNSSGIDEGALLFPYHWKEYDKYIDIDSLNSEAVNKNGEVISEEIKAEFVHEINKKDIFRVRASEALEIFEGHWIPIPYFRMRNDSSNPYHQGPQDWCRMWLGKVDASYTEDESVTHMLVLAFDTTTTDEQTDYFRPANKDATSVGNERFRCVTKERYFNSFYTREEMGEWLENIYYIRPSRKGGYFRHISTYLVLLGMLDEIEAFPEITLLKGENIIETSLVLDIGNSRTCGLVVETSSPNPNSIFDFTNARKLQLRDLSLPYKVYEEPFDMQVAFSQEKFGNEATNLIDTVFDWPSIVRVGPEAVRLTSIFESEDSQATMSSPKRYLWDHEATSIPWIKVDTDRQLGYSQTIDVKESALFGIAKHITSEGIVIKNPMQVMQASESRYSRSSLMTFALFEIICQALSQINNVDFRKNLGNSSYKRKLKNIVITCPTAMTYKEQNYLKSALEDAIFLAHKYYDNNVISDEIEVHPSSSSFSFDQEEERSWKYDEATCSQIAFLYGELVEKFKGNHDLFFKYKGKKRENSYNENKESVTIASVDIGGGTTDLMICNYQADSSSDLPFIKPKPIFWEGFNIAGDDIVKRIIEFIILPDIEKGLRKIGGQRVEEAMNYMFGPNIGNQSATHRIYRKQFGNQIATYTSYAAINHVLQNNSKGIKKTIGDIFKEYPKPKNNLITYIEGIIEKECGLEDFQFYDIQIDLDPARINYAISDVVKPVIKQLTKLIAIFDCDILLLSGKSSNLNIIRELFVKTLAISPDKIINLGNYRFGSWYPFANAIGNVKDPKTTVTVGAMISFLSSINKLSDFRVDLSKLNKIDSTAQYLGVLNNRKLRILNRNIIFDDKRNEGEFKFNGAPITIGMRQLLSEDWIATPLYIFDFSDDLHKEKMAKEIFEYPFTITINRDDENMEQLLIDDIIVIDKNGEEVDSSGYFKLHFKTLANDYGYWRDTGSFLLNILSEEN